MFLGKLTLMEIARVTDKFRNSTRNVEMEMSGNRRGKSVLL